jgi:hypothetical protein
MSLPFSMPPLPPTTRDAGYSVFRGYDTGLLETPYCCSFHWLRLPDGRILGLDVVRSGDMGKQALRVFVVEASGDVSGFVVEGRDDAFAPFATEAPPPLDGGPVLGRGEGWIAGRASATGQAFAEVTFSLQVQPHCLASSTKTLLDLDLLYLAAIDYTLVHTTGFIELDGTRYELDAFGPVSVHVGEHLPPYGYAATVHPLLPGDEPSLLLVSVSGEDLRILGYDLRDTVFTYGLGGGGVPGRLFSLRDYGYQELPAGLTGRVDLRDMRQHPHRLLGQDTVTASAEATLHLLLESPIALGRIVFDVRGSTFLTVIDDSSVRGLD